MKAVTRAFGTIEIEDDKIITLEKGMIGFPEFTRFALIFDEDKKDKQFKIMWLQSMDNGDVAFPVTDPIYFVEDYNPAVSEAILTPLGEMTKHREENRKMKPNDFDTNISYKHSKTFSTCTLKIFCRSKNLFAE